MTDVPSTPTEPEPDPKLDPHVPHASRIYDYLLGGTNNFEIDRKVIHEHAAMAGGIEVLRFDARSNRAFLGRAVRYLAGEAGIRQFLDIGSGLPSEGNVHTVAQQVAPESHIVYVDNDPLVLRQAQPLLQSTAEGSASFIFGDLLEPENVLLRAETALDFTQPVAILAIGMLHWVRDDKDPQGAIRKLVDAVPSGSYLAVAHMARGLDARYDTIDEIGKTSSDPQFELLTSLAIAARTSDEVAAFFEGLELVEPGLVRMNDWRSDSPTTGRRTPTWAGVARKP
jgi:hypothetical protein